MLAVDGISRRYAMVPVYSTSRMVFVSHTPSTWNRFIPGFSFSLSVVNAYSCSLYVTMMPTRMPTAVVCSLQSSGQLGYDIFVDIIIACGGQRCSSYLTNSPVDAKFMFYNAVYQNDHTTT